MRWTRLSLLLPLTIGLLACSEGSSTVSEANAQTERPMQMAIGDGAADTEGDASTTAFSDQPGQSQSPGTGEYQLLGIKDPGLGSIAFAFKIPRGWISKQSFQRKWVGAMPMTQIYVLFRSPDASEQIEYLPASNYVYSDGPGPDNLRRYQQSMGMQPRLAENELAPMSALTYLTRVLLPQMAQNGAALSDIGNERETAPHSETSPGSAEPHMASSASVDGVLPNGNQARVEVKLGLFEGRTYQDVAYSWWATPSITQTASGNLDATFAHTETANASIVSNPAWLRENNALLEKGNQATLEAIRRNHTAAMANIAKWGEISRSNAAANRARIKNSAAASDARRKELIDSSTARMAENDRINEHYVDNVIDSKTKYTDPTTGEQVKLDNRYNHTYANDGVYYQSDAPIQSTDVNWQEMEKVPLDKY